MARRTEYISFFTEGRGRGRDFSGFERRVGLGRVVLPALGVAFIAVSIWWFGFRDADADVGAIVTMDDATIPTLILPAGGEGGNPLGEDSFDCPDALEGAPTEWSSFQGGPGRTGCTQTPVITDPRILWKAEVGIQGWLNNAVIGNGTLYVASAGVVQFVPDRRDAIYALDLRNGNQIWYYQAELDVNGIGYLDGVVVATGDEGRVWALDARNGDVLWIEDFGELDPVYSNPLMVNGMAIVGDGLGNVVAFDVRSGAERWRVQVDGAVRGGAASDGELVFAAGENHEVLAIDIDTHDIVWRADVFARGQSAEATRVFAAPTVAGDLVIVSLVRTGVYAEPAVIALDKATGEIVWQARDVAGLKTGDWANVRSSVAVAGDVVVFGEALSDSLIALDLETGQTRWSATTGSYCLPHWPSPAITGGQVILPRDDGGVYAVDLATREVVWSLYLGNETSQPGGTFPASFDEEFCEEDETGYAILSSPAITNDGVIIVGTLEGFVYAIADRNW